MYECSKEDCCCSVDEQFTYCSDDCEQGLNCGCTGCDCGDQES